MTKMKSKAWTVVAVIFALLLGFELCQTVKAQQSEKPAQLFGCSLTSRDLRVLQGQKENILKGIWKKEDQETPDQVAMSSDDMHVCIVADPNTQKRFMAVFYAPYGKGSAVAIIEEK
jgi:hypothetical protein